MQGLCYFEIPTNDLARVRKFYGDVIRWESQELDDDYIMFKAVDGPGGGFSTHQNPAENPGFNLYFEVSDIPETLGKVKSAGGKIVQEKTENSPEYGFLAFFRDSEGNKVGLYAKE